MNILFLITNNKFFQLHNICDILYTFFKEDKQGYEKNKRHEHVLLYEKYPG